MYYVKKNPSGQYQQYLIILSYVHVFFFAWSKIITMIFFCTNNQQNPGKSRGPTYHLARCWSEGFLLRQFHDQWMFSGNIHYRWRFEQDNPP
jgi:hypothetical protein